MAARGEEFYVEPGSVDMSDSAITVYWRRGCFFCTALLEGLTRAGVPFDLVNIWEDPAGAAFVRSVAGGNETVPTVRVGSMALVNPTAQQVLATAATEAPEALPDAYEPPRLPPPRSNGIVPGGSGAPSSQQRMLSSVSASNGHRSKADAAVGRGGGADVLPGATASIASRYRS